MQKFVCARVTIDDIVKNQAYPIVDEVKNGYVLEFNGKCEFYQRELFLPEKYFAD